MTQEDDDVKTETIEVETTTETVETAEVPAEITEEVPAEVPTADEKE